MDALETFRLLELACQALAGGRPCALATVVGVRGSAYRHEGARMLVTADGESFGAISGGCLESDVVEAALEAIRSGQARLLRYDLTSDDDELWGLGLGCNGVVEVLIQPLLPAASRTAEDAAGAPSRPPAPQPPADGG